MVNDYFNDLCDTLDHIDQEKVHEVASLIANCKGKVFVFGNGGSAATASHFTQDMGKCLDFKFICLNDNICSVLAYGNDVNFDSIFKLQLSKQVEPGDLVIGISCSGNSQNVVSAIIYARHYGYTTIGFTGMSGGQLKELVDHSIHVPSNDMQVCEDIHLIITHTIMKILS